MLERISDTLTLFALRSVEWLAALSATGKVLLALGFVALLVLARHYGLLPSRGVFYPHPLVHW